MTGQKRIKPKKSRLKGTLAVLVTAAAVFAAGGYFLYKKFAPSAERVGFRAHYLLTQNRPYVVFGDEIIDWEAALYDNESGGIYISVKFLKEYIDGKAFYEPNFGAVTITDYNEVLRLYSETEVYYVNGEERALGTAAKPDRVRSKGGDAFLPAKFLEKRYGMTAKYQETTGLIVVDDSDIMNYRKGAVTSGNVPIRVEPDYKSPILGYAVRGDVVHVYSHDDKNFYKARMFDGLVGYIAAGKIRDLGALQPAGAMGAPQPFEPRYEGAPGRITMMWEQFFSEEAAANTENWTIGGKISVLSPTWFSFAKDEFGDYTGGLDSFADAGYAERDSENGNFYEVWPMISDNFDPAVTSEILADTWRRDAVIARLIEETAANGGSGINVDFEMVRAADVEYYTEFLRELAPLAHLRGLAVSVDMYVPKPYNLYYNRKAVAEVCDYVIIMGYDEHFKGDVTEGPVASIGFVEEGIAETLKEVPKEKIILGVPLYNRVWTRTFTPLGEVLSAEDFGMKAPRADFTEHGAGFLWDEKTKTTYAEYDGKDEDGNFFKRMVWMEDETSLDEKLKLADKYGLAGVAGWKKKLETERVWEMFENWRTSE